MVLCIDIQLFLDYYGNITRNFVCEDVIIIASRVVTGIRLAMVARGMTQKSVAERSGFTEQQFSDMLNGRKVIRAEHLPPIAKALNVDINDLFVGNNDTA